MFKQEQGFSLVELAIAAGLAVALAATAVTVLSGTTASLSSNANGAAGTSSQYNYDVLNDGGAPSTPTVAAPATPASVVAGNVTQTGATLTWNAVSGATSYVAFINGEIAATLDAGTTSYDYTGLTAGTGYTLAVVAVNAGGNSSAAEATITTAAVPVTVTSILATHGISSIQPWMLYNVADDLIKITVYPSYYYMDSGLDSFSNGTYELTKQISPDMTLTAMKAQFQNALDPWGTPYVESNGNSFTASNSSIITFSEDVITYEQNGTFVYYYKTDGNGNVIKFSA